jgi:hypothetical protein
MARPASARSVNVLRVVARLRRVAAAGLRARLARAERRLAARRARVSELRARLAEQLACASCAGLAPVLDALALLHAAIERAGRRVRRAQAKAVALRAELERLARSQRALEERARGSARELARTAERRDEDREAPRFPGGGPG